MLSHSVTQITEPTSIDNGKWIWRVDRTYVFEGRLEYYIAHTGNVCDTKEGASEEALLWIAEQISRVLDRYEAVQLTFENHAA